MRETRVCILKTGDTLEEVRAATGDFDAMFLAFLRPLGVSIRIASVHQDEAPPPLDEVDALIVTGSPHSVTARAPWADRLATYLQEAIAAEKHVLGVCYGHQLLAHALGGRVERNPLGYEVGTVEVLLTEEGASDALLGGVAGGRRALPFQSTHLDAVVELPPSARLLASSPMTAVQAFAVGERAWGVQFHPEFSEEVIRLYIARRTPLIRTEAERRGLDPGGEVEQAWSSIAPTPAGQALIERFVDRVRAAVDGDPRGPGAGDSGPPDKNLLR